MEQESLRVASLNYCLDQQLAPHLAADAFFPAAAHGGRVESLLQWQPDVVLATPFTSALTVRSLQAAGLRVETVAEPQRLDEVAAVRHQLTQLTGADLPVFQIEAKVSGVSTPGVVFYLANQWSFGSDTLWDEVAERMGWRNLAAQQGGGLVSVSLEQVLAWQPEILVFEQGDAEVGLAYLALQHRALRRYIEESDVRVIYLPRDLSGCMAQRLPEVIDALY
ncbi:ABC transporter substrate-binding protein [Aliidiomarina sanyensis]|uniref:Fe/B12 periplasmic-binding domain-containing protein n=1 Tax=Aliidiomarina sanyensis TaxID=1249555 RepID=A0A432WNV0_9GAMM|nr:hypothetical protein [Aliidiomarina sanyensis]RUO35389.1 hypothetical protein CWE11_05085 [Aliidiomarina sanyensis]